MTTELEVRVLTRAPGWTIRGRAQIDERPPTSCALTIRGDGSWSARVATFTLAAEVDLFLISDEGGHFYGPASVASSRADSGYGLAMSTALDGIGPLLVVAPERVPELSDAEMVDAEVVEE
jgi:hypothetical protein